MGGQRLGGVVTVVLSLLCVTAVVLAVLVATGSAAPALALGQNGHWMYNRVLGAVFHVDGGTKRVDARVGIPGGAVDALFVLQGPDDGFLVGRTEITSFGKSTLTVAGSSPAAASEVPVGLEMLGGPYLIYRQVGTIVRLGVPPSTILAGGPLGNPVHTDDGTLWVRRTDTGDLCSLARGSDRLVCGVRAPAGAHGELSSLTGEVSFVNADMDGAQPVAGHSTLRPPVMLGADLPADGLIGDRDARGRLPVVDDQRDRLLLCDSGGVPAGRAGADARTVDLGPGTYATPVASDDAVAVLDTAGNRLLTFDPTGRRLSTTDLPPGTGPASMSRGEDGRVYVDAADGTRTHVMEGDGTVTTVATGSGEGAAVAAPPAARKVVGPPRIVAVPAPGPPRPQPPGAVPPAPVQGAPAPPPPVVPPAAPTGVTAELRSGGSVAVSWNAVDGRGKAVRYRVSGNGAVVAETGATTATATGLTPGRTYTYTVEAITADGTSPPSAPSPGVTVPAPLGPVVGLVSKAHNDSGSGHVDTSWQPPADLGGRQVVGYQVTATSSAGRFVQTVTTPSLVDRDTDRNCAHDLSYAVRTLTRPPGGGAQEMGAAATAQVTPVLDCTPGVTIISATGTGPGQLTVVVNCAGGARGGQTGGDLALLVAGRTVWQQRCQITFDGRNGALGDASYTAVINGLTANTSYRLTATSTTLSGTKTSPAVTGTTTP